MAKILTKREPTGAGDEPTNLEFGELAVNTVDGKLWVGNAATDPVLIATKGGALIDVNETAHGFQTLDCVYFDGVNWQKAQANAEDTVALGVVVSVVDVDNFSYAFSGRFEIPGNALLDDEWYYLSDTVAGALTATEPAGISQPLVYSETGDFVSIYPYRPAVSPTGALALPPGNADGNTLRWEADTSQWEPSSDMYISDDGNILIGTNTPATPRKLYVQSSQQVVQYLDSTNTACSIQMADSTSVSANRLTVTGDDMYFQTNGSERMRVDSNGRVGIGTASPSKKLHVLDSSSGVIRVDSTGTNSRINFTNSGLSEDVMQIGSTGNDLTFITGLAERMRIDSAGNVAIGLPGTVNPGTGPRRFSVGAPAANSQSRIAIQDTTNDRENCTSLVEFWGNDDRNGFVGPAGGDMWVQGGIAGKSVLFGQAGLERMRIDSGGNLLVGKTSGGFTTVGVENTANGQVVATADSDNVAFFRRNGTDGNIVLFYNDAANVAQVQGDGTYNGPISDIALKDNIHDSELGLSEVLGIKVRAFNWKKSGERVSAGFVAQELQEVLPEAVSLGDSGHLGRTDANLIPVLVKAIQEQQSMITELHAEVEALKNV